MQFKETNITPEEIKQFSIINQGYILILEMSSLAAIVSENTIAKGIFHFLYPNFCTQLHK